MALPSSLSKLRLPVVVAPMFLVSGPQLVIEACKHGTLGTFPALNQRTTEGFEQWLVEIKAALGTEVPFGVNLIVHRSNPRLEADLAVCVKHRVPLIITSLGAVPEVVSAVHSYGGLVFHDVTNLKHAQKAAQAGVDGLIAVCAGAGGHAGTMNPFALVAQIRRFFDKTVLLAGAISKGSDVLAARAMGADLAYMGTRFVACQESLASQEYRDMLLASEADDIVYTAAVSGVPASFMRASLERAGIGEQHKGEVGLKSMAEEAKAWKNIWSAGQGVSAIQDVPPVGELISRLEKEFLKAKATL